MTTPNGAIVFNTGAGSDTLSSGLGPATPVNGSGASTTAASAVVTGINTTGVSPGDLLWVQSSSGRQFSIIASVDSGTQVTCDDTFANTEASRTWAIGGKRATWDNSDSRKLFQDVKPAMVIETETNQSLTSALSYSTQGGNDVGGVLIRGVSGSHPIITQSANAPCFQGTSNNGRMWSFDNLHFVNSNATKNTNTMAIAYRTDARYLVTKCTFGDQTNSLHTAIGTTAGGNAEFTIIDCEFKYLSLGPYSNSSPIDGRDATYINCISHNNGSYGFNTVAQESLVNCISHSNAGHGFVLLSRQASSQGCSISNCISYGNTGDGIRIEAIHGKASVTNCLLVNNGGYGIQKETRTSFETLTHNYFNNNAFYNNTSGEVSSNITAGPDGHITLTADPFTDAAAADFTINSDAGGGSTLRSTAITLGSTETRPFRWLDTSTGGTGATNVAAAKFTRLE